MLTDLTGKLDWTWIVGNHDPGFADHCGGKLDDEVELAGIVLRHEVVRNDPRPEISGHFHPKLRVNLKGRHVSRRCFVVSPSKMILPAFGSLTGGLDAHHPEILGSVGGNAAALVPGLRPAAALPARGLVGALTSIAIAPVGDSTSRAIAGRRLPKVAACSSLRAAWRSNLKPLRVRLGFQPVEMLVEVGDALIGIETHRLFEIGHRRLHCRARDKGQARLRALHGCS